MSDPGNRVDHESTGAATRSASRGFKNFVRKSPWIVISVGVHVVAFALLGVFYVTKAKPAEEAPPFIVRVREPRPLEFPDLDEPPPRQIRDVIPDQDEAVTTDDNPTDFPAPPFPDDAVRGEPKAPSAGDGFDSGGPPIGTGKVTRAGGSRPSTKAGPGSGKTKGGGVGGPTRATEKAVLDGMRWLLRHQNADGSWTSHGYADQCHANSKCQDVSEHSNERFDEGLTGLALLAFLGAGYGPDSKHHVYEIGDPAKKYRIGDSVKRALQWLVKRQKPDGSFTESGPFMYNEAICALALSEAYGNGVPKNRAWRSPAQKAIAFLASAQRPSPADPAKLWGWRYDSRSDVLAKRAENASPDAFARELHDADTSVSGWAAMAFKSAAMAGLEVPERSIHGALDFARWVATDSGLSGYQRPDAAGQMVAGQFDNHTYHAASMAAVNACIRVFLAHDVTDAYLRKAADVIAQDLPRSGERAELDVDYYYWYYATLALNQIDGPDAPESKQKTGKHWQAWNAAMTAALLELQDGDAASCTHGGWIVADRWAHEAGPVYATAINTLTLEVYYRYPNSFR